MADTTNILRKYSSLLNSIGRSALHANFPNDFEYYMLSLELTTHDDNTIEYFAFPVMPHMITKRENNRINVKKTFGATIVINSKAYTPSEITIKGDFGRNFLILTKPREAISFTAIKFSRRKGFYKTSDLSSASTKSRINDFDFSVKTGYGATKLLQSIVDKASGTDETGKPFKLYLYNPALGESYMVVPSQSPMELTQNKDANNMIWGYTLNLISVAEISSFRSKDEKGSLKKILAASNISKAANLVAKDIANFTKERL